MTQMHLPDQLALFEPKQQQQKEVARLVGIAIHRALELMRLDKPLARAVRDLGQLPYSGLAIPQQLLPDVRYETQALLEQLCRSSLGRRLDVLRDHVIARELPLVLSADGLAQREDSLPTDAVVGTLDLLARDPADGQLVIIDYKTDRALGKAAIQRARRHYEAQAASYQRAVQLFFKLQRLPACELWFLRAGRIERL